jgi:hypothetical protein
MLPLQSLRARRVRARIIEFCDFLYTHRSQLPYDPVRPMRSFWTPFLTVPSHATDCSESSALILRACGAPTPFVAGLQGNTSTMLARLQRIPRRRARRGDLVVFEATAEHAAHVVILQQGGWRRDPLMFSHGMAGVFRSTLSAEASYHRGQPMVFLRSVPVRY